ncbi:MAG: glycosyltransferase family 4 protein [Crenarchaeota archaeon]|nr:glycosyltransferase family 4 protein [Thermoproteota archaeon]
MRNIIAVFHDNDLSSGATKSFLTNIEYMASRPNDFHVIAIVPKKDGKLSNYLKNHNINVLCFSYGGCVYKDDTNILTTITGFTRCLIKQIISYISSLILVSHLKKRSFKPDIVYSNTSTINFGFWIAKHMNANHVWHIREFCLEDQGTRRLSDRYFSRQIADSIQNICISKVIERYYKKKYGMRKSIVLYNDFSPDYRIDEHERISHEGFNFLITGSLCEKKGQLFVIQAFDMIQKRCSNYDCNLYIAGKINSYGEYLKDYVKRNAINNVIFCGLVENMNELRKKMDFSFVASEQEAFGRTVIEDMLAGIIVFGTDHGAIPEIIDNGKTGVLYSHQNAIDLCEKVIKTISSPNSISDIRRQAIIYAEDFCEYKTATRICELFKRECDA